VIFVILVDIGHCPLAEEFLGCRGEDIEIGVFIVVRKDFLIDGKDLFGTGIGGNLNQLPPFGIGIILANFCRSFCSTSD